MADTADSSDNPKPFPPPPEEPIRIFCPQKLDWIQKAWIEASDMPNVEWCADWSRCKLMIFLCTPARYVTRGLADFLECFFARDGRESLVYEYDPQLQRFVDWDRRIFDREPWRIMRAT